MKRSEEITHAYFDFLDKHLADILSGNVTEMMELNEIAAELNISAQHLGDTIQQTMGNHPCHFYDSKILEQAMKLLVETDMSIAGIAKLLTYEPSNFSKFFKKFRYETPGQFRTRKKLTEVKVPGSSP
ncbi:AraC family transcriptional regulator [Dyadobacter sp. CY312]|uniref:helix-turn-helix domain-containing protein n=1 Tax=Dyadobacter sp. CY312 TaxID=2907303 RepID=UPI001F26DA4D|nr:AraC family transcriptional regulator [Dyadobacter sp. CY312]MCE7042795.1 AraC family transcriptional regulator [Dyadobacter sp. CY312]